MMGRAALCSRLTTTRLLGVDLLLNCLRSKFIRRDHNDKKSELFQSVAPFNPASDGWASFVVNANEGPAEIMIRKNEVSENTKCYDFRVVIVACCSSCNEAARAFAFGRRSAYC